MKMHHVRGLLAMPRALRSLHPAAHPLWRAPRAQIRCLSYTIHQRSQAAEAPSAEQPASEAASPDAPRTTPPATKKTPTAAFLLSASGPESFVKQTKEELAGNSSTNQSIEQQLSALFQNAETSFTNTSLRFERLKKNTRLPEVAIFGRSNVGKSSFVNAVAEKRNKHLALVSSKRGSTKSINMYGIGPKFVHKIDTEDMDYDSKERHRHTFYLVDMPGHGQGSQKEWGSEISKFIKKRRGIRLRTNGDRVQGGVVLLVDALVGLKPTDFHVLELLAEARLRTALVLTKADQVPSEAKLRETCAQCRDALQEIGKYFPLGQWPWEPQIFVTALGSRQSKDIDETVMGARMIVARLAGLLDEKTIEADATLQPKPKEKPTPAKWRKVPEEMRELLAEPPKVSAAKVKYSGGTVPFDQIFGLPDPDEKPHPTTTAFEEFEKYMAHKEDHADVSTSSPLLKRTRTAGSRSGSSFGANRKAHGEKRPSRQDVVRPKARLGKGINKLPVGQRSARFYSTLRMVHPFLLGGSATSHQMLPINPASRVLTTHFSKRAFGTQNAAHKSREEILEEFIKSLKGDEHTPRGRAREARQLARRTAVPESQRNLARDERLAAESRIASRHPEIAEHTRWILQERRSGNRRDEMDSDEFLNNLELNASRATFSAREQGVDRRQRVKRDEVRDEHEGLVDEYAKSRQLEDEGDEASIDEFEAKFRERKAAKAAKKSSKKSIREDEELEALFEEKLNAGIAKAAKKGPRIDGRASF